jgi:acyl carrier protein
MLDKLIGTTAAAFHVAPETLDADTDFRRIGIWDSFAALALVYGIEDAFGVLIGYGALHEAKTVGELAALIEHTLKHRP